MKEKIKIILENTYKVIAYVAIILVLLLINYDHIIGGELGILKSVIWAILGIALFVLLNKFIINKIKEKRLFYITIRRTSIISHIRNYKYYLF